MTSRLSIQDMRDPPHCTRGEADSGSHPRRLALVETRTQPGALSNDGQRFPPVYQPSTPCSNMPKPLWAHPATTPGQGEGPGKINDEAVFPITAWLPI